MVQSVATKKARIVGYVDPDIRVLFKKIADKRQRSESNLIEVLITKTVEQALKDGEISDDS